MKEKIVAAVWIALILTWFATFNMRHKLPEAPCTCTPTAQPMSPQ